MFRIFLLLFSTVLLGGHLHAQPSVGKLLATAEKQKKKLDFSPALKSYQAALSLDPNNVRALNGVVDIYLYGYELYDSAALYIDRQLQNIGIDTNYLIYYNYANCLRLQEKPREAITQYKFFKKYGLRKAWQGDPVIIEVGDNINACLNALKNEEHIYEPFEVENMDFFINSVEAEYTPVYIEDQNLLLYNARYKDYDNERRDVDNLFFENIYYFDLEESVASTYNPSIEQTTHQCVIGKVFNSDSILVFYQNKVWVSTMTEDRLNNLQPLPVEFGSYYFQPHGVFSKNRKKFIFSARSLESHLDLYESDLVAGTWTVPKRISFRINSAEDEDAPFLSADGKTLYFSSKGHGSSGGYDFYMSKYKDGEWGTPENMGYPMNSAGDDIYITWNEDERSGFFSSNRVGGFGGMDIYTFGLIKKTVRGTVKDDKGEFLAGTKVQLSDLELGPIESVVTDENGDYSFLVDPQRKFEIKGTKDGYFTDINNLDTYAEDDVIISNLSLEKDPGISLYILVVDAETNAPLDSVRVSITDNMLDATDTVMTDPSGDYHMSLPNKKLMDRGSYNLTLQKRGYLVMTVTYNILFDKEGQYNVLEDLKVKMESVKVGVDLTDIIDLNPIYFDYNRLSSGQMLRLSWIKLFRS